MPWTVIDGATHAAGKPVVGAGGWAEDVVANLNYLYGVLGTIEAGDIPNGSFEIDSDADGVPDNWTRSLYPGGTGGRDTANAQHGAACVKLTHPGGAGNGGGTFTSDYVPCSSTVPEIIGLIHWATVAGMHNLVQVSYYDAGKVPLSTTTLYDSQVNPTTPTQILLGFTPPATARFYKLLLFGGQTDVDTAGTAYFDGLTKHPALQLSALTNTGGSYASNQTLWTDIATITLTFPFAHNLPVMLSIPVQVGGNVGVSTESGFVRLRIGTTYSNEVTGFDAHYEHGTCNLTAPIGTFDTAHGSKLLTVTVQLKTSSGDATADAVIPANSVQGGF